MGEVGLGGLGVVVAAVAHRTTGGAHCQASTVELVTRAVPELCCLVYELIESGEDIICGKQTVVVVVFYVNIVVSTVRILV